MKSGWFEESRRHRLARFGIKTGRKSSSKKELNVLEGNPMFFPKKKEKLNYTPTYNPSDMGKVGTDIIVGTGVEVKKHAPLIAGAIVYKKAKKYLKKDKKKKSEKKGLLYPTKSDKEVRIYVGEDGFPIVQLTRPFRKGEKRTGLRVVSLPSGIEKKVIKEVSFPFKPMANVYAGKLAKKEKATLLNYPENKTFLDEMFSIPKKKPKSLKGKLEAIKDDLFMSKKKLNYPKEIKKKYPVVTKELTKLSKKHDVKKPKLSYGKNKRLATFYPNKYIKLSTRLQKESKSKRKDVAQHEFKHYTDIKKTDIRDVEELERRAVKFEQDTV